MVRRLVPSQVAFHLEVLGFAINFRRSTVPTATAPPQENRVGHATPVLATLSFPLTRDCIYCFVRLLIPARLVGFTVTATSEVHSVQATPRHGKDDL
jgi:hypothetical protein